MSGGVKGVPRVAHRSAKEIDEAYRETERKNTEWQKRVRAARIAQGLTSHGKPRVRKFKEK